MHQIVVSSISGVIRANRFARFARIGWFAQIGTSSNSLRTGLTRYKNWGCNCEWFARIDSRESRCEPPVPLRRLPFCVAFAPLLLKGNLPFSDTGKPPCVSGNSYCFYIGVSQKGSSERCRFRFFPFSSFFFRLIFTEWGKKKTINIKNFGGTPPGVRPVCPGDTSHLSRDMSRLSRGHSVPLVLIYT